MGRLSLSSAAAPADRCGVRAPERVDHFEELRGQEQADGTASRDRRRWKRQTRERSPWVAAALEAATHRRRARLAAHGSIFRRCNILDGAGARSGHEGDVEELEDGATSGSSGR